MQVYLINIPPNLHHRKWRELRVTLLVNMLTGVRTLLTTINAVLRPILYPETRPLGIPVLKVKNSPANQKNSRKFPLLKMNSFPSEYMRMLSVYQ